MNEWTNRLLFILEIPSEPPGRYSNNAPLKKKSKLTRNQRNVRWNNEAWYFTARISKDLRDWQYPVLTWKSRKGHSDALLRGLQINTVVLESNLAICNKSPWKVHFFWPSNLLWRIYSKEIIRQVPEDVSSWLFHHSSVFNSKSLQTA